MIRNKGVQNKRNIIHVNSIKRNIVYSYGISIIFTHKIILMKFGAVFSFC